jgi:hypothetical protein
MSKVAETIAKILVLPFSLSGCSKPIKEKNASELLKILDGNSEAAKVLRKVGDPKEKLGIYPNNLMCAQDYEYGPYPGGANGVAEAKWLIQQMLMNLSGLMTDQEKAEFRRNVGTYGQTTTKILERFQTYAGIDIPRRSRYSSKTHTALLKALTAQVDKKDWKAVFK